MPPSPVSADHPVLLSPLLGATLLTACAPTPKPDAVDTWPEIAQTSTDIGGGRDLVATINAQLQLDAGASYCTYYSYSYDGYTLAYHYAGDVYRASVELPIDTSHELVLTFDAVPDGVNYLSLQCRTETSTTQPLQSAPATLTATNAPLFSFSSQVRYAPTDPSYLAVHVDSLVLGGTPGALRLSFDLPTTQPLTLDCAVQLAGQPAVPDCTLPPPYLTNPQAPPVVTLTPPHAVRAGETATFTVTASDTDGVIQLLELDCRDGSFPIIVNPEAASLTTTLDCTYPDAGPYTPTALVVDDEGGADFDDETVFPFVGPDTDPPTASVTRLEPSGPTGIPTEFFTSASDNLAIAHTHFDCGGGAGGTTVSEPPNPVLASYPCVFDTPGEYTVTLTAEDLDGNVTTGSFLFRANALPTPQLGNGAGDEGQDTPLAVDIGDDDGVVSWEVDCGSGGPPVSATVTGTSISDTVTCVYPDDGSFTATLTATDTNGETATASASVTVSNLPPVFAEPPLDISAAEAHQSHSRSAPPTSTPTNPSTTPSTSETGARRPRRRPRPRPSPTPTPRPAPTPPPSPRPTETAESPRLRRLSRWTTHPRSSPAPADRTPLSKA